MKLAIQLFKEFWFPALIAALWAALGLVWKGSSPMIAAVKDAAASFFLVSWATGQYFRVKKQSQVEGHLNGILTRLSEVAERIEVAGEKTVATMTGGSSYCYVQLANMYSPSTQGLLMFTHQGNYPLYDVEARFVDMDEFEKLVQDSKNVGLHTASQTLKPGTVAKGLIHLQWFELGLDRHTSPRSYTVEFSARNATWMQVIRLAKVGNRWVSATRVYPPGQQEPVDFSYADFPRNPDGTLAWDLDGPFEDEGMGFTRMR